MVLKSDSDRPKIAYWIISPHQLVDLAAEIERWNTAHKMEPNCVMPVYFKVLEARFDSDQKAQLEVLNI